LCAGYSRLRATVSIAASQACTGAAAAAEAFSSSCSRTGLRARRRPAIASGRLLSIVGDGFACAVWRHLASGRLQDYEHVLGVLGNAAQHVRRGARAVASRAGPEHCLRRDSDAPNIVDEGDVVTLPAPERARAGSLRLRRILGPLQANRRRSGTASLGASAGLKAVNCSVGRPGTARRCRTLRSARARIWQPAVLQEIIVAPRQW
jgi:hypothetical protein